MNINYKCKELSGCCELAVPRTVPWVCGTGDFSQCCELEATFYNSYKNIFVLKLCLISGDCAAVPETQ